MRLMDLKLLYFCAKQWAEDVFYLFASIKMMLLSNEDICPYPPNIFMA